MLRVKNKDISAKDLYTTPGSSTPVLECYLDKINANTTTYLIGNTLSVIKDEGGDSSVAITKNYLTLIYLLNYYKISIFIQSIFNL